MTTAKILEIHFNDEAPRIGSGIRLVVALPGRKWVKLFCPATLITERMRKDKFDRLEPFCRSAKVPSSRLVKIIRGRRRQIKEWNDLRKANNEVRRQFSGEDAKPERMLFDGGSTAKEVLALLA